MATFHYTSVDREGKTAEGTVEAADRFAVYAQVKKDGGTVTSVREIKTSRFFSISTALSILGGVSTHDKIIFAQNLGSMIEAGLPMTRALSIMERQAKPGKWKKILSDLGGMVSKGQTLSDAMRKYPNVFSSLFISMVKAGEESGNIAVAFKSVAHQMDKSYQLSRKIRGAMLYPAVIFTLMIVIGVLMMIYMVPTLTATFKGLKITLPLSTRIIIGISDFLKSYILYVVLALAALATATVYFMRTPRGKKIGDFLALHTPIVGGIVVEVNAARTTRTLSSLISAGVDIVVAISVTKEVIQNGYYKEVLDKVEAAIQKGEQISAVFLAHEKLYPLFVGEMTAVGEETGKIGSSLENVAAFYEDEVDQKTKDMSSVLEPFLMIFIGLAVGFFAISMLSPMYSLTESIK